MALLPLTVSWWVGFVLLPLLFIPPTVVAQRNDLGFPKPQAGSVRRRLTGQGKRGGGLVLPSSANKQKKEQKQAKHSVPKSKVSEKSKKHRPLAELFPRLIGQERLGAFLESLGSTQAVGTEELVAEYSFLSDGEKAQLLLGARKLPSKAMLRLAKVYAALPEKRALPLLMSRLRIVSFGKNTRAIVEAVLKLDEERAVQIGIELLNSKKKAVRVAAEASLRKRLRQIDHKLLLPKLDDGKKAVRLAVLRLLGEVIKTQPATDPQALVDCLWHRDGSLRSAAARYIMQLGERAMPALLPLVAHASEREGFYLACIILAQQQVLQGKSLLPKDSLIALRRSLDAQKPIQKAAAGIALGLQHYANPAQPKSATMSFDAVEQKSLIAALLSVMDAEHYYPEFAFCHDSAQLALRLLTGEDFGSDKLRWHAWWEAGREQFKAYRQTLPFAPASIDRARLAYLIAGETAFCLLGPLATEPKDVKAERLFRLDRASFATLLSQMREAGFLSMGARFAEAMRKTEERFLSFESSEGKVMDGFVSEKSIRLRAILAHIENKLAAESWQQFHSPSLDAKARLSFWQEHDAKLRALPDLKERRRYILDLCCTSLDSLSAVSRKSAFALLFESTKHKDLFEKRLTDALLQALVLGGGQARTFATADAIALAEILSLVADDQLFERVLIAVAKREDMQLSRVLPKLLALAGPGRILLALASKDGDVRAVAAKESSKLKHPDTFPIIVSLLADKDPFVRLSAAMSVGKLGLRKGLPGMKKLLTDQDLAVRQAALMGLAGVGGDQVFDLLYAATARGDLRERRAAVIGLSDMRNAKVGPALLRIAVAHYPEELGKYALFGLAEKGGPKLRSEIHTLMRSDIQRDLRREFLFLLGEMQDATAFSPLLLELKAGRAANRACRLLTAITGHDLCQDADRVAKYEAWQEAEYDKGQSNWFLAALKAEGLKSSLTTTHLTPGATPAVIEELCRVLETAKSWPVRALASHFLRDLTLTDHGTAGPRSSLGAVQAMAERYRSFSRAKHASGR